MTRSIKHVLSLLLVVAVIMTCLPAVMAADDQTSGTVPVTITASNPTFNVVVPTTLPIHMDAYGDVTCGNITIINNSAGPVLVEDTQLTALNGWTLVDYDTTTFRDADKGQHRVAFQLNRGNGVTAKKADTGQDFIPAKGGQQTVSVAVKLPYQGVEMTDAAIAKVVFVLSWYKIPEEITCAYTVNGREAGSITFHHETDNKYELLDYRSFSLPVEPTAGADYVIHPPAGFSFASDVNLVFESTYDQNRATFAHQEDGTLLARIVHQNYFDTEYVPLGYWGTPYVTLDL